MQNHTKNSGDKHGLIYMKWGLFKTLGSLQYHKHQKHHSQRDHVSLALLELLGRLKHILLSKYPSAPVHAQCFFAFGVFENANSIMGVRMCWTENMTRSVCSNGDQAEIKWSPELTYLLEGRTYGEIVLGVPIILPFWQLVHCPVAGITGLEVSKAWF
jgi:hypothetical protein